MKPKLLFFPKVDSPREFFFRERRSIVEWLLHGGFDVSLYTKRQVDFYESLGVHIVGIDEDWTGYDYVLSEDVSSPAGSLFGGKLNPAQIQWLQQAARYRGKLGVYLDDPIYNLSHLALTIRPRREKLKPYPIPDLWEVSEASYERGLDYVITISADPALHCQLDSLVPVERWVSMAPYGLELLHTWGKVSRPTPLGQRVTDKRAVYYGFATKKDRIDRLRSLLSRAEGDYCRLAVLNKRERALLMAQQELEGFTDLIEWGPRFKLYDDSGAGGLLKSSRGSLIIGSPGHRSSQTMRIIEALGYNCIPLVHRDFDPEQTVLDPLFYFADRTEIDDTIARVTDADMLTAREHTVQFSIENAKSSCSKILAL